MKKRWFMALLGLSLSVSMMGLGVCAEESMDAAAQAIEERKAAAEESGEYEKVVFAFYNWTGRPAGTDRIQEKINERTRETLGLEVELLVMDSAAYTQNARLMLSSGEQIDIWNSALWVILHV